MNEKYTERKKFEIIIWELQNGVDAGQIATCMDCRTCMYDECGINVRIAQLVYA